MKQRMVTIAARPEFWLLALLAWLLLSAGRSAGTPWARVALTEALRWGAGIGLALVIGTFLRHTQAAARVSLVLVGTLAALGIAGGFQPARGGLAGPYQDHQLYGSVLLLLLPIAFALALTARETAWRLGGLAAVSAGTLCLFLSQTRSAWAGLLAAALVFSALWLARAGKRRDWRRFAVMAAALAGAVLAVWLLLAPTDLRAPLTTRVGTLGALGTDISWQSRLSVWRGAARLTAAHPLVGIGLGRYPGVQWAWTGAGHPLSPALHPSLSEEAHNFYLQTAGEIGLVGLGLYGAALAAFVVQGLRRLRQIRRQPFSEREALVIASLSLIAGQAVDALASPSWQFAEASLFFWALLGLGLAALRGEEPEPATLRSPTLRRAGQFALSGGVAVALAANILPVGLLTPVEAYTPQSNWVFVSSKLSGPTLITAGQPVTYTLTATYSYVDASKQTQQAQVDVTFDPTPGTTGSPSSFGIVPGTGTSTGAKFGTAGTVARNILTTNATTSKGDRFQVSGMFYDRFTPKTAVLNVIVN